MNPHMYEHALQSTMEDVTAPFGDLPLVTEGHRRRLVRNQLPAVSSACMVREDQKPTRLRLEGLCSSLGAIRD